MSSKVWIRLTLAHNKTDSETSQEKAK